MRKYSLSGMRISSALCFAPFFFLAAIVFAPANTALLAYCDTGAARNNKISQPTINSYRLSYARHAAGGPKSVFHLDCATGLRSAQRKSLLRGASLKRPVKNRCAGEMSLAVG